MADSPQARPPRRLHFSLASIVGFTVDFATMVALVQLGCSAPVATGLALPVGVVVSMVWMRLAGLPALGRHGRRDALVSVAAALLNLTAVGMLLVMAPWDYRIAWLLARIGVSFGWNSPLQRFFVYAERYKQGPS